jgi:hypothetical protein
VKSSQILISPPTTIAPIVLKPAVPSPAPKVIEAPSANNAKRPVNVATQPDSLRKLSGEGLKGSIKAPEAEALGLASELAPLVGGMPILVPGKAAEMHKDAAASESSNTKAAPATQSADASTGEKE